MKTPTAEDIIILGVYSQIMVRAYEHILADPILQALTDKHIAKQFEK